MSSDNKNTRLLREKPNSVQEILKDKKALSGRSVIRKSIDKEPFYGYTFNENKGMASMALAIDLITDEGNSIGIQYHLINSLINFDTSGIISFDVGEFHVKIEGRNLRPIYEYLLEHRLVWIQPALSEWDEYKDSETVVDSVTIKSLTESE